MCNISEKADFLIVWSYQEMASENVISEKAISDYIIRSAFLVPEHEKSRLPIFSYHF